MDAIENLLTRGVDKIYPSREALEKVLRSGKKLCLYQGFDPTGARLHIGHSVAMRKLRQFQELGHKVIFLIGDFTATIGDPSGKTDARSILTHAQVLENAKEYQRQASKILRFDGENPVELLFNNDWLSKLSFADVISLASRFTVQQMIERDMFQARIRRNDQIGLHEFLYPLMVGYDSVAMKVDLELGGTDQMFNMMAGRKLVSQMLHKEKFVMTVPLLTDSKGVKIGKTEGNVIGITDSPNDFFGKIMALGDDAIIPCFTLLTDTPLEQIEEMKVKMEKGENPMDLKKQLAFELTKQFNSVNDAEAAQQEFEKTHQENNFSEQAEPSAPANSLKDFLIKKGYTSTEAKKMIEQGAVDINGNTVKDRNMEVNVGDEIKVGKKKYYKVIDQA